jgi:actin-like ATPase involved in cell morphogenesis
MCGGGAQVKGIGDYLAKRLNVAFVRAQNPELCGIKGANLALTHLDDYRRSLLA